MTPYIYAIWIALILAAIDVKMLRAAPQSCSRQLENVQVYFRHGDRTPSETETYPNDPRKSNDWKPYGHGQLTDGGKHRMYKLGEELKTRYGRFLGEYHSDNVYARSTDLDRTKMTLQLVLAGLYPLTSESKWTDALNRSPFPYEYKVPKEDEFFEMFFSDRHKQLFEETNNLPEVKKMIGEYQSLYNNLAQITGISPDYKSVFSLLHTVRNQESYGLERPTWCTKDLLDQMEKSAMVMHKLYVYNEEMKRLAFGKVMNRLKSNLEAEGPKKINLYSVHDHTVLLMLILHGLEANIKINFGMTVVIEKLRGVDRKHYVRILYYPGKGDEFKVMKLAGCNEMCPMSKYLEIIAPLLPKNQ